MDHSLVCLEVKMLFSKIEILSNLSHCHSSITADFWLPTMQPEGLVLNRQLVFLPTVVQGLKYQFPHQRVSLIPKRLSIGSKQLSANDHCSCRCFVCASITPSTEPSFSNKCPRLGVFKGETAMPEPRLMR